MKSPLLLAVLTVALFGWIAPARAVDQLDAETLTVSGYVYQATADPNKPLVKSTLTTKFLLETLFGVTGVKTSATKYFYDATTDADVLASTDGMTIHGTLFAYAGGPLTIPGLKNTSVQQGKCALINGQLTGNYFASFGQTAKAGTGTVSFSAQGQVGTVTTIIVGTFKFSQPF